MIGSLPTTGLIVCKVWVIRLEHEERAFIKKTESLPQVQKSLGKLGRVGRLQLEAWGVTMMAQHGVPEPKLRYESVCLIH